MEKLIKNSFGIDVHIEPLPAPRDLPFYMTNGRSFYKGCFDDISFLLVSLSDTDRYGAIALEKQLVWYMDSAGTNIAYIAPALTKAQRDAFLAREIPFICPPDQLYLPFLGIALSNRFREKKRISVDHFSPAAQSLFLYLLYQASEVSVLKKDAAAALGLTKTSITRASEQLKSLGLISETAHGKEIRMAANGVGRAYYEMGKPYLVNPVAKTITAQFDESFDWYYAGESALSMRSMLNEPSIPIVAVCKKRADTLHLIEVDEKWTVDRKMMRVELWRYDPALFAQNHIVDPVSMAVSLKDDPDERVQGELESCLEEYQW